jgi:hypothetical protein
LIAKKIRNKNFTEKFQIFFDFFFLNVVSENLQSRSASVVNFVYYLHPIYTGQVTMETATIDVLFAADKYNIKELVHQCEIVVLTTITLDNAVEVMVTSRLLASKKIFNKAQNLIKNNPGQVKGGEHWEQLKAADPKLALEILETCMFKQSNT